MLRHTSNDVVQAFLVLTTVAIGTTEGQHITYHEG